MSSFPAELFGDLYHQRWRIEEAFKRIKLRLALEHVTGLSQLAAMQDLAAKVICNRHALSAAAAHEAAGLPVARRINRTYALTATRWQLPKLLLCDCLADRWTSLLNLLSRRTRTHRPGRSNPRPPRVKPHKFMTRKVS